jgi:hypothetical protein
MKKHGLVIVKSNVIYTALLPVNWKCRPLNKVGAEPWKMHMIIILARNLKENSFTKRRLTGRRIRSNLQGWPGSF